MSDRGLSAATRPSPSLTEAQPVPPGGVVVKALSAEVDEDKTGCAPDNKTESSTRGVNAWFVDRIIQFETQLRRPGLYTHRANVWRRRLRAVGGAAAAGIIRLLRRREEDNRFRRIINRVVLAGHANAQRRQDFSPPLLGIPKQVFPPMLGQGQRADGARIAPLPIF